MARAEEFDIVVVGAGQSGGPLAGAFAKAGRKTALIERRWVGGTCVNDGCTPTKTMVASARVAYLARRAADYGVDAGEVQVDLARVIARKRGVVESFRAGSRTALARAGVELIHGEGRFAGPREIALHGNGSDGRTLTAPVIVLNTGARPAIPAVEGLDRAPFLDSTSIMELDTLPSHLLVLGGGYIGLEFGQMFRRFGSEVTIVQHGPRLLGREDADIADAVAAIMREDGCTLHLDSTAARAEPTRDGLRLTIRGTDGEHTVDGSHLLVATGRVPNTATLELDRAGVGTDARGFIHVNGRLETTAPSIYAMGDVRGGPAFTHISYDDFRILRANLLEGGAESIDRQMVPYTVFIDPQLGRIGMSEEEARASGRRIAVARMPMTSVARAIEMGETRGFMKAVVDLDTRELLGAAVLGVEGGELMAMLQIAMMGGVRYPALRNAIFAHPTLAESFNNLFATVLTD